MNTQKTKHTRDIAPARVAQLLTSAARRLDGDTVAALRQARNVALERQSLCKRVSVLSAGHSLYWLKPHSTHQWVATVILFVSIIFGGVNYWQHAREIELGRLDAAILSDDMPLEVFVDNYSHPGQ
jgi:Protein of unknown function (DUF3619)